MNIEEYYDECWEIFRKENFIDDDGLPMYNCDDIREAFLRGFEFGQSAPKE